VDSSLEIVAFDTGIYAAAVLRQLPLGRHLAARMVQAARAGAFKLLVLDGVIAEYSAIANRESDRMGADDRLLEFLLACPHVDWPDSPSEALIERDYRKFLPVVPHHADARIAVELAVFAPDYFVHSNSPDWSSAADVMCRTRVRTIVEYLEEHGIEVPPKNAPLPKTGG
jgi:hypothetical protein